MKLKRYVCYIALRLFTKDSERHMFLLRRSGASQGCEGETCVFRNPKLDNKFKPGSSPGWNQCSNAKEHLDFNEQVGIRQGARSYPRHACPLYVVVFMQVHDPGGAAAALAVAGILPLNRIMRIHAQKRGFPAFQCEAGRRAERLAFLTHIDACAGLVVCFEL